MAAAKFDFLPVVVAEIIASYLHGQDLVNLGFTCKFWHGIASTNHTWKLLVERKYGCEIEHDASLDIDTDYKLLCIELSFYRIAATELLRNGVYKTGYDIEILRDSESEFGEVVQVNAASSLQLFAEFIDVVPGKYRLLWRTKLDNVYLNCNHLDFIARPEEFCGSEVRSVCNHGDLTTAEHNIGRNQWFEADMGQFVVTSLCKVFVAVSSRSDYLCSGISWDYIELRPLMWYQNSLPENSKVEENNFTNFSRKLSESGKQQLHLQNAKESLCLIL